MRKGKRLGNYPRKTSDVKTAPLVSKQPSDQIVELLERCCVLVRQSLAPDALLNIDATNPKAVTLFNLDGGPAPMLVGDRFVMPQDQPEQREPSPATPESLL
jgi:hypothetical protein